MTTLQLDWTDNADNEDTFYVERRTPPITGLWEVRTPSGLPANTETWEDTTALVDVEYEYRVRCSVDDQGTPVYSGYSNTATGEIPGIGTPGRTLVASGTFTDTNGGNSAGLSWTSYNNSYDPAKMSMAMTTLNGNSAIAVTWDTTCSGGERWGGILNLPGAYPEVYFTFDIQFGPYWSQRGQKLPGLDEVGNQHTQQLMSSGRDSTGGQDTQPTQTDPLPLRLYWYDSVDSGQSTNWGVPFLDLNTPHTIELYFKTNTSDGSADGVFEARWDPSSQTPTTLRAQETGKNWWAAGQGESYANSLIDGMVYSLFFGGNNNDPDWYPLINSTVTLGQFKVEVPE